MGWDKIWSFNKKIIDPTAPRYTALLKDKAVLVNVKSIAESSAEYPLHPKVFNPSFGFIDKYVLLS